MDSIRIYHCPFHEFEMRAGIEPGTVSLILVDPHCDKKFLLQAEAFGAVAARILRPDGTMICRYGDYWFDEFYSAVRRHLQPGRCKLVEVWNGERPPNRHRQSVSKSNIWHVFLKDKWRKRKTRIDVVRSAFKEKDLHPHQQSLEVVETILRYFSQPKDVVCDLCGGSFTTAAACYRTFRRFVGCDIDANFVRIGFERLDRERSKRADALELLQDVLLDVSGNAANKKTVAETWEYLSGFSRHLVSLYLGLLPQTFRNAWEALPDRQNGRRRRAKPSLHKRSELVADVQRYLEGGAKKRAPKAGILPLKPPPEPNSVTHGDCIQLIPRLPDESINCVITSPPYAEQRKGEYQGVPESKYPEFTVKWMTALRDRLVHDGNVLIVIDPHVKDGEVAAYVLRTQLLLREHGWRQHKSLIWEKRDRLALGHRGWPRHCYEEILWFSKTARPFCDPWAAGTASNRIGASSYGHSLWTPGKEIRSGIARITDVIVAPVGGNEKGIDHPAQFPLALVEPLIKTFCPKDGTVLDPFAGSGTTLVAARKLGRAYYGFDLSADYCQLAQERLGKVEGDILITAG